MRTTVNRYRRSGKRAGLRFLWLSENAIVMAEDASRTPAGRRPMPFDSPPGLILRMAGEAAEGTICSACRRRAGGRIIVVTMKSACSVGVSLAAWVED